jgi:hypothetical protein
MMATGSCRRGRKLCSLLLQVKRALEWLQGERVESKRFAAVLILKVSNNC